MRISCTSVVGGLAAILGISHASAQSAAGGDLNRVGLSYRMGFNITASFKNVGGYASLTSSANPGRTPNNDPFNYDNGYIYADSTTAQHPGYTWYYGYTAGTPQRPADAPTDFDLYRSSSAATTASSKKDGDPHHSVELTYNRQIDALWRGFWGLEAGLGFTDVTIKDQSTYHANVMRATDTYQTGGGAILKPAPFSGTFEGPAEDDPNGWPLVGLAPVASTMDAFPGAATISGNREFDAQVASLRLGPYFELPLSQRWSFSVGVGLALAEVFSDFKFNETVSIDPSVSLVVLPPQAHSASGSNNGFLVGWYTAGTFSFAINPKWKLFAGAQFQDVGNYTQSEGGKQAVLRLGQSIFASFGGSYSF